MSNNPEDQILFNIGHLADSFARLEYIVTDILSFLVNAENPKIGQIICDRLSLSQTVNLISDFLKNNSNDQIATAFVRLTKKIQQAAYFRNDILHSTWATPSADDDIECEIIQERARKRYLEPKYHDLDSLLNKMEEATFFIQEVEMELLKLLKRIKQEHPTRR